MSEQERKVEIEKCPKCGNHIGVRSTGDELAIHPDPSLPPTDPWYRLNRMTISSEGIRCDDCGTLLLSAFGIPCAVPTKSPGDGEIGRYQT